VYSGGEVYIPDLAKVGRDVSDAADAFDKAYSAPADALAPGPAWTGWATGEALPMATGAWSTFVSNLADQIRAFGADLTRTSQDYRAADNAAAYLLAAANAGLPAGLALLGQVDGPAPR
jgi:hypothetical protein